MLGVERGRKGSAAGWHTGIVGRGNHHVQRVFLPLTRKLSLSMLDLRRLILLRELRARGTIAAVAEALSYTPSAVSQQLAQLQREAGIALTERVGRRLRLTDAGVRLVAHADVLLARLEEAEAELQDAAGEVHGRVKLASLQTPLLSLVPPALDVLGHRHPCLRVELFEMEPERSLPAVVLGEYDVALAEEYDGVPRPRYPELQRTELGRDPIVVALPRDHDAAAHSTVSLRDLRDEPWLSAHADTQFAQAQLRACRLVGGFEPDVRHWANDIAILIALVAAGQGVVLLPGLARGEREERIVIRPIEGADLGRTIYALNRLTSAARPSIRALIGALQEVAETSPPR
jgi:DNA-binding transcriptional LysR family regulator